MRAAALLLALAACGAGGRSVRHIKYPDGSPHFEYEIRNGVPDGVGRVWWESGGLRSEGMYAGGAKHGRFSFFTEHLQFDHQAVFENDVEVWRSTDRRAVPPDEVLERLATTARSGPKRAERVTPADAAPLSISRDLVPSPYFTQLDRTSSLTRAGMQVGVGSSGSRSFGAANRLEAFGNWRNGTFGAYGQLGETILKVEPGMLLVGRQTLEVGGTYHRALENVGQLTTHAGLLFPVGHDDESGHLASTAGAFSRPADAAISFPSSTALRTGATITRSGRRFVAQGDVGLDLLLGGEDRAVDALVRANAGVGFGMRAAMVTLELANTIRASDPGLRIHTLGVGGTFWFARMWLSACISFTTEGNAALVTTVGYGL